MGAIELKNVSKHYGGVPVLEEIGLEVRPGEFLVILGASGGGKTTFLNLIAGLTLPSSGTILFEGTDITKWDVSRRNIAYVFQDYALYPHMTVRENIRFPLENMKMSSTERERKVREVLGLLHLNPVGDKIPGQLSGGQKQRVAIGRALVRDPFVFLFDEPLNSLDQRLRDHLRVELKQLHRRLKKTFIYVTHDQLSAMILGDRIAFLAGKRIQQIGPPQEIYLKPRNVEVARFMGFPPINLLTPEEYALMIPERIPAGAAQVGIRPEHLLLEEAGGSPFEVDWVQKVGYAAYAYFTLGESSVCALCQDPALAAGMRVDCRVSDRQVMFFDSAGNRVEGN